MDGLCHESLTAFVIEFIKADSRMLFKDYESNKNLKIEFPLRQFHFLPAERARSVEASAANDASRGHASGGLSLGRRSPSQ
jgi:hypothetical protein